MDINSAIDRVVQATRAALTEQRRPHTATYRLQFHPEQMTFERVAELASYLRHLGVSHVYASPLLAARHGSSHGYDVVDPTRLNPELGTREAFDAMIDKLLENGLGLVLDIVPNHMAVGTDDNAWWNDVLRHGRASAYAHYFDIDWNPPKAELRGKVLLPILGAPYGEVLEAGDIRLAFRDGEPVICCPGRTLPINPTTATSLPKAHDAKALVAFNGEAGKPRSFDQLHQLLEAQPYRLAYWKVAADEINYRRFFEINDLAGVRVEHADVFSATHRLVQELLDRGVIDGLRIDHVDGLLDPATYFERLQHRYLVAATRRAYDKLSGDRDSEVWPAWNQIESACIMRFDGEAPALYIVAEKILGADESLPEDWSIAGTTGYEALNSINGLFVDPDGWRQLDAFYRNWTCTREDFDECVHRCKLLMIRNNMAGDLEQLATWLDRLSEGDRRWRDATLNDLRAAVEQVLACFPVYRTYVTTSRTSNQDRRVLDTAITEAKRRSEDIKADLFDFVRDVLRLDRPMPLDERCRASREAFVGRFQQASSAVMAKGFEDTALYRYLTLNSANEVGGEPAHASTSVEAFHRANTERLNRWPDAMVSTSTHDTKRSEDLRARINVLSEMPDVWHSAVTRWSGLNRAHRRVVDGEPAPSRNDEYLLYQTLVGVWPTTPPTTAERRELIGRVQAYLIKAAHEAKLRTNWTPPNEAYDRAVMDFIAAVLDVQSGATFLDAFDSLVQRVLDVGLYTALSQALLKLTVPGLPDVYQGQELWDFSLVDPDNRRPVDFARRATMLQELQRTVDAGEQTQHALARELGRSPRDDRLKLYVTWRALEFRKANSQLTARGAYTPLSAAGPRAAHTCAFARVSSKAESGRIAIVVVPRLLGGLMTARSAGDASLGSPMGGDAWADTWLDVSGVVSGRLMNWFTGEAVAVRDGRLALETLFGVFPVALLTNA